MRSTLRRTKIPPIGLTAVVDWNSVGCRFATKLTHQRPCASSGIRQPTCWPSKPATRSSVRKCGKAIRTFEFDASTEGERFRRVVGDQAAQAVVDMRQRRANLHNDLFSARCIDWK